VYDPNDILSNTILYTLGINKYDYERSFPNKTCIVAYILL
jgi:hypothetical protein